MSKKVLVILVLALTTVFLIFATGCVTKKKYRTLEQLDAQKLAQANAQINDLQQKGEALDKSLKETQASLANAEAQNKQLVANVASLKDQIGTLEGQKAELDKAVAAGQETEATYKKKVSGLNYAIANMKKKAADMESSITTKDAEIASLKQTEATLKTQGEDQAKQIAGLNSDKSGLTAELNKTVASKKSTTLILGVLLALAIILAIIGFVRKRGPAA